MALTKDKDYEQWTPKDYAKYGCPMDVVEEALNKHKEDYFYNSSNYTMGRIEGIYETIQILKEFMDEVVYSRMIYLNRKDEEESQAKYDEMISCGLGASGISLAEQQRCTERTILRDKLRKSLAEEENLKKEEEKYHEDNLPDFLKNKNVVTNMPCSLESKKNERIDELVSNLPFGTIREDDNYEKISEELKSLGVDINKIDSFKFKVCRARHRCRLDIERINEEEKNVLKELEQNEEEELE